MEFRKVISFGKSSYVVSLPKAWIEKNNIQKGDSLILEEGTYSIMLKARENAMPIIPQKKVIEIEKKDMSRIRSEIIAAYLGSYDIIKIIGDNLNTHTKNIKEILHNLTGIELLEQDNKKIIAKNIMDPQEIAIPILIRRIDNIARTMFANTLDEEESTILEERDLDINRLVYLINRVVNAAMDKPQLLAKFDMTHGELQKNSRITNRMESVGDFLKRINRHMQKAKMNAKEKEHIKEVLKKLQNEYLKVMKAFHTHNIETAYEVEMHHKEMMDECTALYNIMKGMTSSELVYNLKALAATIRSIGRELTVEIR